MANAKTTGFAQGIYEQSATQKEMLGTLRVLNDGRKFRYSRNGATELAAGVPTIAAVIVPNHFNQNIAAAAIGDTVVSITLGATAATENQYKDGYLQINDGTGQGHQYLIASNPAHAGSGSMSVVLVDPIRVALVASGTTEASLVANPHSAVVVGAANGLFTGVTPIVVTAYYYFWAQTGGVACCQTGDTAALGTELASGAAKTVAASAYTTEVFATAYYAGVDTEFRPMILKKD